MQFQGEVEPLKGCVMREGSSAPPSGDVCGSRDLFAAGSWEGVHEAAHCWPLGAEGQSPGKRDEKGTANPSRILLCVFLGLSFLTFQVKLSLGSTS